MRLLSHGKNSDLFEHISEVCLAAESLEERIICACHDIGKATTTWQQYARNEFKDKSPHPHAVTGGLLASLLIKTLDIENSKIWSLVALHTAGGHHSHIGTLPTNTGATQQIVNDEQAKFFFINHISTLLPEINKDHLKKAWQLLKEISPMSPSSLKEYDQYISTCGEDEKLQIFLLSRSLLGRLCYQDHQSAAKQSGNTTTIMDWRKSYPDKNFIPRALNQFIDSDKEINKLRTKLKKQFHSSLKKDSFFYFIDAPTGLGKTETMLSGAEILVEKFNSQRIIFTVPQVSIADQIYGDYFKGKAESQIWNYIRQEKSCSSEKSSDRYDDNNNPAFSLDIAIQPFSESYNVTTFNQILLAICHPLRTRCIRSIGLKDAIVIMDEFHKLPFTILPYFFRIAEEYAKLFNCRFILGSATPLGKYKYLGIENAVAVDSEKTVSIYRHQLINYRRSYTSLGKQTINQIAERVKKYHADNNSGNLLVVLNLVSKGTWPLLQQLSALYNPWQQLKNLESEGSKRVIIFLDGLVPPVLRRKIVLSCKKAMQRRPITLITTQMVEVGVDLDFDHGIIDYQGIASTIQRGGRVGREGRKNGKKCLVEVFSLIDDKEKTSFQILSDVHAKNDLRMKDINFAKEAKLTKRFWKKEVRFYDKIRGDKKLHDSDLVAELENIQNKIFSKAPSKQMIDNFFLPTEISNNLGINFTVAQLLAELFANNYGTELLILENNGEFEQLTTMVSNLYNNKINLKEKKELNKFIVEHKITVSSPSIIEEMALVSLGSIECPDMIQCKQVGDSIF
ncbi:MAG: DEAD/DEAH box helicase family protein [Verrucomicrobiota bacterium]|nr:DEAD/DEAH box helicase family protein [Verrucomicrobiota bacterium]